jgi:hypothetical protein
VSRFIPTDDLEPINLEYVTRFSRFYEPNDDKWWVVAHLDTGAVHTRVTVTSFENEIDALSFMNQFVGRADVDLLKRGDQ